MWTPTFKKFTTLPSVLNIDVVADALVDIGVDMLSGVEIMVSAPAASVVEFSVLISHGIDVLAISLIVDMASIGVGVLGDVNGNVFAAAKTAFDFDLRVSL